VVRSVDGRRVRKLWAARVLFVLAAAGLGAVVIEERQDQAGEREPLRSICSSPPKAEGKAQRPGLAPRRCTEYLPARAPKSR
jgi:hypothetical protein